MTEKELLKSALTKYAPDPSEMTARELIERQKSRAKVSPHRSWIFAAAAAVLVFAVGAGLFFYMNSDNRILPADSTDYSADDIAPAATLPGESSIYVPEESSVYIPEESSVFIPEDSEPEVFMPTDKGQAWIDFSELSDEERRNARYECSVPGIDNCKATVTYTEAVFARYLVNNDVPTDSCSLISGTDSYISKLFLRDVTGDGKPEVIAELIPKADPDQRMVKVENLLDRSYYVYRLEGVLDITAGIADGEVMLIAERTDGSGSFTMIPRPAPVFSDEYRAAMKEFCKQTLLSFKDDMDVRYSYSIIREDDTFSTEKKLHWLNVNSYCSGSGRCYTSAVKEIIDYLVSDEVTDNLLASFSAPALEDNDSFNEQESLMNAFGERDIFSSKNIGNVFFTEDRQNAALVELVFTDKCIYIIVNTGTGSDIKMPYLYYKIVRSADGTLPGTERFILEKETTRCISALTFSDYMGLQSKYDKVIKDISEDIRIRYYIRRTGEEVNDLRYELVIDRVELSDGIDPAKLKFHATASFSDETERVEYIAAYGTDVKEGAFRICNDHDLQRLSCITVDVTYDGESVAEEIIEFMAVG